MTISVRLPFRVEQALASYCVETQRSKSEVIIELLEQRFSETDAAAIPYERAVTAGFIGCLDSGAEPQASYKDRVRAAIAAKHGRT